VDKFVPAKGEVFAAKSYQQFEKRRARLGMNAVKKTAYAAITTHAFENCQKKS
jgi:hypothetical protein